MPKPPPPGWITPEDKALIRRNAQTLNSAKRWKSARFDVERGTKLRSWMKLVAEWIVSVPEEPNQTEIAAYASTVAGQSIHRNLVSKLLRRPDFRDYMKAIEDSALARARAAFERDLPEYVKAHRKGLDLAVEAQDYDRIHHYTRPALDRIMPKKQDQPATPMVTINISPRAHETMQQIPEVEAEVLPQDAEPELLTDGA